jgi:hypothetical protein
MASTGLWTRNFTLSDDRIIRSALGASKVSDGDTVELICALGFSCSRTSDKALAASDGDGILWHSEMMEVMRINNQICTGVVKEKGPGKLFCDGGRYKRGRRHDVDTSTARTLASESRPKREE